jgi:hypothetical protein
MTAPLRRLAAPRPVLPAASPRPVSRVNPLEGRGRSLAARRRIAVRPGVSAWAQEWVEREAFKVWWGDLVEARCGTREVAATVFGVTFQTACNWFDRDRCPMGDKVMLAVRMWPGDFGLVGADDLRGAA